MSGNNISGAAMPIILNGREYWAEPLNDVDMAELDEWVRAQLIRSAESACADLDVDKRREVLSIAMQEASGLAWYGPVGLKMMTTVGGFSRIIWQMLRHRHPDITVDEVQKALCDPKALQQANRVFRGQNTDPFKQPAPQSPTLPQSGVAVQEWVDAQGNCLGVS